MAPLKLGSHNIKTKWLNNNELNSNVFQQIYEDENNLFVSKTTRDCLRKYTADTSSEKKKSAKNLWKNLLKDSVCLLKINDKREKLYQSTKTLLGRNQAVFQTSFNEIRNASSYGIDELAHYFDDFVDFESVLYGTGDFYRDHIHHVLQVWGIGIGLLWGSEKIKLKLSEGFDVSEKDFHFQIENSKERYISKSELWAIWTITALCHDLGYPLEKASQINQKVKKIVNHFGCLNFNELNFNFDILNSFIVEKFLNIVSSKTFRPEEKILPSNISADSLALESPKPSKTPVTSLKATKGDPAKPQVSKAACDNLCPESCKNNTSHNKTEIQHKFRDKFAKSLEDYKHGSLSGLLLFKKLTYFLETDFAQEKCSLDCEDLRQFYIRKEILRAICGHTCPKIYHLDLNTISFLLILCDELQEWGRPRFEELLSGDVEERQTTRIEKFETKEFTSIHISNKYNVVTIKDGDNGITENEIVRKKFKNLHFLLRSAKDDGDRKVNFKWDIILKNKKYSFTFTSEKDAYQMFESTSQALENEKAKGKETEFKIYVDESSN